ncbi:MULTISPECIES: DUF998 domain-containing protein [Nonomuraea]|uniref:DUF998 domain-containing protein n=1 Tax=Nonomuraea ferruginea TaxID=46174 RepID=A0ABT4T8X1_9ACTN|nr:DUF998 domain-containing protein [Nonomuraea ferruginea]MDA0645573.1 DUF998 domain-containing protein [Nonomuraea ferruginea]
MRRPARWGLGAVGAGVVVVLGLDVAALGEIDPLRRTISEHGLTELGWLFGLGVTLLAVGSAAIGVSLARARLAGAVGTLALLAWSAGLLVAAYFPKHDWSVGPSLSGSIHRAGSLVAFLCLPLAALIIARPWRRGVRRPASLVAFGLGVCSLLYVSGLGVLVLLGAQDGLRWWQVVPLGLVERGLAAVEVAAVAALGFWAAGRKLSAEHAVAGAVESRPKNLA